jgi:hypothetical protein
MEHTYGWEVSGSSGRGHCQIGSMVTNNGKTLLTNALVLSNILAKEDYPK